MLLHNNRTNNTNPQMPARKSVDQIKLKGRKILVVDDDLLSFKYIEIISHSWGIDLLYAGNGKIALQLLQQESVDLILTDFQMNEMDGVEFMQKLKLQDHLTKIPVLE
jgi:two-component system, chemotaxis family, chemotaxis protein CheY